MVGTDRGDDVYNAVAAANPDMNKLSNAEKNQMKTYFETIFGADTVYIKANADVVPSSHSGPDLEAAPAIPGTVTSGAGAGGNTVTNAPGPLEGKGSIE